jgi:radical SAM superfamily enzyme YgiQ (UPF0313 family)
MHPRFSCRALLVYPRFNAESFWNYKATCEIVGAKYTGAPLGMITVAALLPRHWNIRLIDRNIEQLTPKDLEWADLVMTGGMLPQQRDTLHIVDLAHQQGKPVIVGGPDVTCSPDRYAEVEFRVLGEAEEVMAEFLQAWQRGDTAGTFTARSFPDISRSPVPRFDLLKLQHYMHVGVQRSRGCPFNCEFCNVVELNGRVPRSKESGQMLKELDTLLALGYRGHVDFVDDNLIGNPRTVKPFLVDLAAWLERNHRPFEFSTEASLNLAEDDELLGLMRRANFFAIFVGIESPDHAALQLTHKHQNTRRDLVESIQAIYRAGIYVNAGFIIGLDGEHGQVDEGMIRCIEDASIPICMVGLLYALPNTRLHTRLSLEGRLHPDSDVQIDDSVADQCTSGLNFTTLRPRIEMLEEYRRVLEKIYAPDAYFGRVLRMAKMLDLTDHKLHHPPLGILKDVRSLFRIFWRGGFRDRGARAAFWRTLTVCLIRNPRALRVAASFAALYFHYRPYARTMDARLRLEIEKLSEGSARLRPPVPVPAAVPSRPA